MSAISILVKMEQPTEIKHKREAVLDKVKRYITQIESSEESRREWQYVKNIYNRLSAWPKLSREQEHLLSILEPIMMKYGQQDPVDGVDLRGDRMHRFHCDTYDED
jgi:hypothetical protein